MKKLFFAFLCFVGVPTTMLAQCPNNNVYYTDLTPTGVGLTATSSCTNGGEYNTFYACQGAQYTISSCGSAFNTVITMYWHVSGTYINYNSSNNCPTNNETFNWTATESGVVRVLLNRNGCNNSALCGVMSITQLTECPEIITASDCTDAINVCTNINFVINPNGYGLLNEIPALGSLSNPDYGHTAFNPWGTTNEGCLRANELNSTWMIVNVETGGTLEFTFGGLGTQSGFYDWIMYPYGATTCSDVVNNIVAPIRCNWNGTNWGGTGIGLATPAGGHPSNYEPALTVADNDQLLIVFSNWSSITTNVPLEFYGTAVVSCSPYTPLPVELISYSGKIVNNDTELKWTTATETNNDYFLIERTVDHRTWSQVGIVNGSGNSLVPKNYTYIDKEPGNGEFYYRLTQFDFNGENEKLGIVALKFNTDNWRLFPNPSKNQWNLTGNQNLSNCKIIVREVTGKEVQANSSITDQKVTIQLEDHRPGIYFIQVISSDGAVIHQSTLMAQ